MYYYTITLHHFFEYSYRTYWKYLLCHTYCLATTKSSKVVGKNICGDCCLFSISLISNCSTWSSFFLFIKLQPPLERIFTHLGNLHIFICAIFLSVNLTGRPVFNFFFNFFFLFTYFISRHERYRKNSNQNYQKDNNEFNPIRSLPEA